jgi:hypothetical protein
MNPYASSYGLCEGCLQSSSYASCGYCQNGEKCVQAHARCADGEMPISDVDNCPGSMQGYTQHAGSISLGIGHESASGSLTTPFASFTPPPLLSCVSSVTADCMLNPVCAVRVIRFRFRLCFDVHQCVTRRFAASQTRASTDRQIVRVRCWETAAPRALQHQRVDTAQRWQCRNVRICKARVL